VEQGRHRGCSAGFTVRRSAGILETEMLDVVLLAASVAFFLASLAYVRGCDRL
jgi:hypothetical protein